MDRVVIFLYMVERCRGNVREIAELLAKEARIDFFEIYDISGAMVYMFCSGGKKDEKKRII